MENRIAISLLLLSVNVSIVWRENTALNKNHGYHGYRAEEAFVLHVPPANRRLRGRMLAATAKTAKPENHPTLEARALTVPQESIRPPLVHRIAQIVPGAKPRLPGRMLAATAQIVLLPSSRIGEKRAPTATMARPRLLAQMRGAIVRIVPRASIALGLDKTAPTARLASTQSLLVQPLRPRARLVWQESTRPLLVRAQRPHVQIAQQTPSLQPVLLPVKVVVWVMCFTFKALVIGQIQMDTSGIFAHHARQIVGLIIN